MTHSNKDPDEYDVDTPYLRMKLEVLVAGPHLSDKEKATIAQLINVAQEIGNMLFSNHDPEGYALYKDDAEGYGAVDFHEDEWEDDEEEEPDEDGPVAPVIEMWDRRRS